MKNLEKNYNPKEFENKLYKEWEEGGYFRPEGKTGLVNPDKKPFTIVMPPPNVTGKLHMGHALNNTIQDIFIRRKRMQNYAALWVPGTDHASISTEAKVTEKLRAEGKNKREMGREKFLEEAWSWTEEYGGTIKKQLRKLGVSCDWSRERFTLDEKLSDAVNEVFIKMYEDGLIYQGNRIVNWCPSCRTALSDAEVDHEDSKGHLWYIKYPFENGDDYITIATTRPETLLGDLAVAVDPTDERYSSYVGKNLILPLVGRKIPLIADEYVDKEYGTGCVKITPSHDPNDYEVGQRHDLGQCVVIDEDAKISEGYGKYSGMDRYEARKEIIKDLESQGLLEKIEDIDHAVGSCSRCKTTIEPLISKQWFVKMKDLSKPAIDALKSGKLHLIPERFDKVYLNWLENIKDWCISRQLWWGHRLPVYYCKTCGKVMVGKERPDVCEDCGSSNIVQDEDSLDTWFSSALWPFSTLGWPEDTQDLEKFFPTDILVTGYDIIFFWVIRMVFSSLYNMKEVPFHHVIFTGLIRDEEGRKMSKSLGNGVDPLEVIDKYGADALRFTLVTGNTPGNDARYIEKRVEANRNFANKLWNASRFVLMNVDEHKTYNLDRFKLEAEDKWIISRLNKVAREANENLDKYEYGIAATTIHDFAWNEFCDWYIEFTKNRLYGDDEERKDVAISTLIYVLDGILRLLHPFIPFITEEIYSHLPQVLEGDKIIDAVYPSYNEDEIYEEDERAISLIIDIVTAIRNQRNILKLPNSKKNNLIVFSKNEDIRRIVSLLDYDIKSLAFTDELEIITKDEEINDAITLVLDDVKLYIPLKGLIDYEKELKRLIEDKKKIESEIKRASGKLANEKFVSKAPANLVEEEKQKLEKYEKMLVEIEASIAETEGKL